MKNHKLSPLAWFMLMFLVAIAGLLQLQPPKYYPQLGIEGGGQVGISFLLRPQSDSGMCKATLERMASAVPASCPNCRITGKACLEKLSDAERLVLSDSPLSVPSAHLADGVITFTSQNPELALAACRDSELHGLASGIRCFAPGSERRFLDPKGGKLDLEDLGYGFLVLLLAQIVAKLVCYLIIRYERLHAHLSHDMTDSGPQKFHALPTPRIGGVGLMVGVLVSGAALMALPQNFPDKDVGLLLLASMPAFLGGLTEDITKKVGVAQRLVLTMLSAATGAWLLGAVLEPRGIPGLDLIVQWTPAALAFTVFAIAGATNAVNIIDGYNGLAAGVGVIVCSALAFVAVELGDAFLFTACLMMAGALLGFLVWNWPGGKIFLGDGGAYLLGFWISELSVLMLVRHPEVSPWLPMLLMIYPVFETLFSIYRRKIKRNQHPGHPDSMHLHQLIYKRLVRVHIGTDKPALKTRRNSLVSWYAWGANSILALVAIVFWQNSAILFGATILFCVLYTNFYYRIVGWRAPAVLQYREHRGALNGGKNAVRT